LSTNKQHFFFLVRRGLRACFQDVKNIKVPSDVKTFSGSRCWFTGKTEDDPEEKPEASRGGAKAFTEYRLRLHDSNIRKDAILREKELIDIFWQ
jgi:hypothetical protein